MRGNFIDGVGYLVDGFKLIFSKGLKRFILVPVTVNAIIFSTVIVYAAVELWNYFYGLSEGYPAWAVYSVGVFLFFIYTFLSILITATIFVFITNIIASPFYGILAEKTEKKLLGKSYSAPMTIKSVLLIAPRALIRELRKLLSYLPWLLIGAFCFIFPLISLIAPLLWFVIMAWILAIQYVDYTPDNHGTDFPKTIKMLKQQPLTVIGFGIATSLLITFPILNLVVPPAAIAGGTKLWLDLKTKAKK